MNATQTNRDPVLDGGLRSVKRSLRLGYKVAKYRCAIWGKAAVGRFQRQGLAFDEMAPGVTIVITSINNKEPLGLTLASLVRTTAYPNYTILVADNGSTDGSIELVESLVDAGWPIRLLQHGKPRPQHEWYDYMAREVDTPYWVGMHEDMYWLGAGWLERMIHHMETHPETLLLGGEYFPPKPGTVEPVKKEVVDLMESLSTWVFCARRELRESVDTSFAFHKVWDDDRGRYRLWDQGGLLIDDVRHVAGPDAFACMDPGFTRSYQHIANLSWAFKHGMAPEVRAYKLYQLADVKRRFQRLRMAQLEPTV